MIVPIGGAVRRVTHPHYGPYQYSPPSQRVYRRIYGTAGMLHPTLPPAIPAVPPVVSTPASNPYDLANDPGYQLSLGQYNAGVSQLGGGLREAVAQALIRFGDRSMVGQGSDFLKKAGLELDPQTLAAIDANYKSGNSTLAQIDHAHELRRNGIVNNLAGRNIINSGETGYQQGEENRGYGNGLYNARNSLLDMLSQGYQSYLDRKASLQAGVTNALMQAYQNSVNAPPPVAPGTVAPPIQAPIGRAPVRRQPPPRSAPHRLPRDSRPGRGGI